MYNGYNFIMGQPNRGFGQSFGGQNQFMQPMNGMTMPGGQLPMGGSPLLGQNVMQMPQLQSMGQQGAPQGGNNGHNGLGGFLGKFGPMFGIAGMMAGQGGLSQLAPLLGGLAGWGLHKAKVF
jgi:hypothetical protein